MEKMKKCKACGKEIAKSAKTCPNCGKKNGLPGWVKALIIVVIILVCIVACVNSCSNAVSDAVDDTENSYKDVNGKTSFVVGETFENKYIKITFDSANTNYTNYSEYADVKDGYKVVQATFSAENIGEDDQYFDSYDFSCYADGTAVDEFYSVDDSSFGDTLSSGKKASGRSVYFEVPKDAQKITIEYDANFLDSTNIEFIVQE